MGLSRSLALPDGCGIEASARVVIAVEILVLVDQSPGQLAVEHVVVLDYLDHRWIPAVFIAAVLAIACDDCFHDMHLRYGCHVHLLVGVLPEHLRCSSRTSL